MKKNKKNKETEEESFEEYDLDNDNSENYTNPDKDIDDLTPEEESIIGTVDVPPENTLGFAHYVTKESELSRNFKALARETRIAYYTNTDKDDVKLFSKSYNDRKYIDKIIDLRVDEDKKKTIITMQDIKCRKDLIEYIKNNNRYHLITMVNNMSDEDIDDYILKTKGIEKAHFNEYYLEHKNKTQIIFEDYQKINNVPKYIDDVGIASRINDTNLTSMGFKGNGAQHSIMSLQAVKNEDTQKEVEQKTKWNIMDTFKSKFT